MQPPPHNLGTAHLGINFWKRIVDENPNIYSKNALLLGLDDDGTVLLRFLLPCSWSEVRQHAAQARLIGASTIVRMQESGNPPDIDSFQTNTDFTKALYRAADIYGLQLVEVTRPIHKLRPECG